MWRHSAAAVVSGLARTSRLKAIRALSKAERLAVWWGGFVTLGYVCRFEDGVASLLVQGGGLVG